MSSVDLVLSSFCSCPSFLGSFFFLNSWDVSAENLTFDQNSQDVSAENLISEAPKSVFLLFLMNVSAEILGFQNPRDVSMNFLTFFY